MMNSQFISETQFQSLIFDFEKVSNWKFSGSRPVVLEFYADWCVPCQIMSPILEQLSEDYKGRVAFYKIDVDQAPRLTKHFGIQSIPTFMFIDQSGQPYLHPGALTLPILKDIIEKELLNESENEVVTL